MIDCESSARLCADYCTGTLDNPLLNERVDGVQVEPELHLSGYTFICRSALVFGRISPAFYANAVSGCETYSADHFSTPAIPVLGITGGLSVDSRDIHFQVWLHQHFRATVFNDQFEYRELTLRHDGCHGQEACS